MLPMVREIRLNTLLNYVRYNGMGSISYLLNDYSIYSINESDEDYQFIKYIIDKNDKIRFMNKDYVNYYNKVTLYLKKNYLETFISEYEDFDKKQELINNIEETLNIKKNVISKILSDIYIYNSSFVKKKKNIAILSVNISFTNTPKLLFYQNSKLYLIHKIIIINNKTINNNDNDKDIEDIQLSISDSPDTDDQENILTINKPFHMYPKHHIIRKNTFYLSFSKDANVLVSLETHIMIRNMLNTILDDIF